MSEAGAALRRRWPGSSGEAPRGEEHPSLWTLVLYHRGAVEVAEAETVLNPLAACPERPGCPSTSSPSRRKTSRCPPRAWKRPPRRSPHGSAPHRRGKHRGGVDADPYDPWRPVSRSLGSPGPVDRVPARPALAARRAAHRPLCARGVSLAHVSGWARRLVVHPAVASRATPHTASSYVSTRSALSGGVARRPGLGTRSSSSCPVSRSETGSTSYVGVDGELPAAPGRVPPSRASGQALRAALNHRGPEVSYPVETLRLVPVRIAEIHSWDEKRDRRSRDAPR